MRIPGNRRQRPALLGQTLTVLVAIAVVGVGQTYTVIPLMSMIAQDFGVPTSFAAWLSTGFSLSFALGFLLAGPAVDRFGPRRLILLGLPCGALSTLLVALAGSFPALVVFRCVQGLTVASLAPTGFAYVAEHVETRRRPAALGAMSSAGLAAAVLMQVAAQALAPVGWRAVFFASAAAMLLLFAVALTWLQADTHERVGSMKAALVGLPRLLGRPRLLALYAATSTLLGSFVIVYTAIEIAGPPAVAGDARALLILRASALPAVIAAPFIIGATRQLSPRFKSLVALLLAAVAAGAAGLAGSGLVFLGVALLLYVAGIAIAAPSLVELIHTAAPDAVGAATALYTAALFVGTSVGPQVAAVATTDGFEDAPLIAAVLLLSGALIILTTTSRTAGP
ncbi:MFS transporter [Pseudonocardia alni]|uniref:MFS transporter n=1 Tax=Pseudonocardia alni TaxID=33907 RepID=UPI00280C07D8|nr:MFS transporter [Pseudonocardia alni]